MLRATTTLMALGVTAAVGTTAPARAASTTRVSLGLDGVQANGFSGVGDLSPDGRLVAFASDASNLVPGDTNGATDAFVRDLRTGRTERVSLGPNGATNENGAGIFGVALSANGRFVAFGSDASDLFPGDTDINIDVFVRDRRRGTTERVSAGPGGAQANEDSSSPTLSADGRLVAFDTKSD